MTKRSYMRAVQMRVPRAFCQWNTRRGIYQVKVPTVTPSANGRGCGLASLVVLAESKSSHEAWFFAARNLGL